MKVAELPKVHMGVRAIGTCLVPLRPDWEYVELQC